MAWSNPDRITASDNTYATANVAGNAISNWLRATNFDFSTIPDDAVILNVTGTVEAKYTGSSAALITAASFVVGNAVVGTQKTLAALLTAADVQYSIDLSPPVVGYPITPALLKVSTTGFAISCTGGAATSVASQDAMWLTVTYMVAGRVFRTRRVRRVNRF